VKSEFGLPEAKLIIAKLREADEPGGPTSRAYAAAMAWAAAEAEGRVQKQGARTDREPSGKMPKGLIADPRAFFAKQFASSNLGLEKSRVAEARAVQT
jgi:hypothetical protein